MLKGDDSMARGRPKKDVENKIEVSGKDRKTVIKEHILKVTEQFKPEIVGNSSFVKSFDIRQVVDLPEIRGWLKESLPDFNMSEKKIFWGILQDLKKEKFFIHKAGPYWARTK